MSNGFRIGSALTTSAIGFTPRASVVSRSSKIVPSIVRVRTGTRTREPTCNCAATGSGSS